MGSVVIDRRSLNIYLISAGSIHGLFWNSKDLIARKYARVKTLLIFPKHRTILLHANNGIPKYILISGEVMALSRITCNKHDFRHNIFILHFISTGRFHIRIKKMTSTHCAACSVLIPSLFHYYKNH
jgi:hypothetical protein